MTAPSLYRTCPHRHLRSVLRRSLARLPGPSRITSRRESSRVTFTWTKKGVAAVLLSFPFTIFFYYISYDCITNERETTPTKRQRGIYDYLALHFHFHFGTLSFFDFLGSTQTTNYATTDFYVYGVIYSTRRLCHGFTRSYGIFGIAVVTGTATRILWDATKQTKQMGNVWTTYRMILIRCVALSFCFY